MDKNEEEEGKEDSIDTIIDATKKESSDFKLMKMKLRAAETGSKLDA